MFLTTFKSQWGCHRIFRITVWTKYKQYTRWDTHVTMVTAMCYHYLAPEGGHPTWEEHFIENIKIQGPFFVGHTCKLNQQKQGVLLQKCNKYISANKYDFFPVCLSLTNHQTLYKNSKWVWSGNTTVTNCRQTHGTARKSHATITRHQEDKLSRATSSLALPHQDDCKTRMDIK